ncbi:MAG TPA: glycosyltransferase [Pirellula sp.]|nr:glycosyltransferase [Pirellula sp.]
MPNILHLIPTLEGGGAERQLSMLAEEQRNLGMVVHIGVRRGGVHEQSLKKTGVIVHALGDYRSLSPSLFLNIVTLIRKTKPEIVQTWLPQMDFVGGLSALCCGVPWIISERTSAAYYKFTTPLILCRRNLAHFSNAIVANSLGGLDYWKKFPTKTNRTFLIPNAVDVDAIQNAKVVRDCEAITNQREILVVGRLVPEKAAEAVVRAMLLVPPNLNVHLRVIGDGPTAHDLKVLIVELELQHRVSLSPFRPDWWGLLKTVSILISMSRFEGQPNVVLETMASGCPLIVSDIPAHREILDAESAIFVPLDSSAGVADAIVSHFSDPASSAKRAENALKRVSSMTARKMSDTYAVVYDHVRKQRII